MAKQLINPIERHVEKAVLAVTGLLLIAAIGLYLVTSPNQMKFAGEAVRPGTIDQKVAQLAADIRDRIRRAPDDVDPSEPLYRAFVDSLDKRLTLSLPAVTPIGPEVPIIDPPEGSVRAQGVVGRRGAMGLVLGLAIGIGLALAMEFYGRLRQQHVSELQEAEDLLRSVPATLIPRFRSRQRA